MRVDALFVHPDAILYGRRQQIVDCTLKHRLPAIEALGQFVNAGEGQHFVIEYR